MERIFVQEAWTRYQGRFINSLDNMKCNAKPTNIQQHVARFAVLQSIQEQSGDLCDKDGRSGRRHIAASSIFGSGGAAHFIVAVPMFWFKVQESSFS